MISIRDEHLERQIDHERQRRGDATMAKTLSNLAAERLMQIEFSRNTSSPDSPAASSAVPAESGAKGG